jgi:hypothetical protein
MKQLRIMAMALIAGGLMLSACDKDDDDNDDGGSDSTAKEVMLVVKPTINGNAVQLDTPYDINGQTVSFQFLKFYLSGIELIDDAGTILADNDGEPILASTEQNAVIIGSTEASHLHMLRLDVGLDSLTNHANPLTADEPLDDVEMHWNWNPMAGYKFVRMDYTLNGVAYESHAATDMLFREDVAIDAHSVSTAGDHIHLELTVDIAEMVADMDFPEEGSHGAEPFNVSYMNKLGTGSPFEIE